ncbi:MAG TPA: aminotransferase class V-fold PLP-dependent enzyme [Gemmatimonadaceae bacterium]|nr:aminotransferase class V-fold PLP-dependent enzyme [Gemmatimonadaceae bacterium]
MNKRDFVRTMGGGAAAMAFGPSLGEMFARVRHVGAAALAQDEAFWAGIRTKFRLTPDYINLENGYYCFLPEEVLEQYIAHVRRINVEASHYFRGPRLEDKARVAAKLAAMAGVSPQELIITRNTTESLDIVISGFDWKPGDEAVMANQDYGAMLDQFRFMARRHGMVNRYVDVPMDPRSDDDVVQVYANAITPNTKLLMVCHMVNITGHILPVAKICDMAHARGVPVMVDGAHAFAHVDFRIPDLHCDYYGSSLHKWLTTPLGAGLLYVKQDRIPPLWPVFSEFRIADDDILKLNHTGTHPVATDLAIENAIAFHEMIGAARKEARLRWVQQYWTSRVRGVPKVVLNTPADPRRSCAIANVGIQGMKPADLQKALLDRYRIFTVAIDGNLVHGVRVTPQVYTSTQELDAFVKAIREIAAA